MKQKTDFENMLSELEAAVKSLENGNVSLNDSIQIYERCVKLSLECQKSLEEAKQKIEIIKNENYEENDIECDASLEN